MRGLRGRLAAGVERDQLAGELAHGDAGARLEGLPRLPAELRERRRPAVGPDVAADLRELVVRHVQAVIAPELEVEVVADDAADLLRVEADEPPDAVVLVDDVVAGAKVGDRRERAADPRWAARAATAEELPRRQHRQAQARGDEPPPELGDAEGHAGLLGARPAGVGQRRLDAAKLHVGPPRLAEVREADQHPVAGPREAAQLVLGLGDAERRERRRVGVERRGLAERHLLERRGVVDQRTRLLHRDVPAAERLRVVEELGGLGGRLVDLGRQRLGIPGDDGGRRDDLEKRRDEPLGHALLLAPCKIGVRPQFCNLDRRVDQHVVEVAQRALREGGERGEPLEAVAEELRADRLAAGRREDVDETAAHRELAALLHRVDALVSSVGQLAGQLVEGPVLAEAKLDRARPHRLGREPLDERVRRDRDEASGGERVERPRPLTRQVRGRIEAGAVRGAAGGHEGHGLALKERRRRLGQRPGGVIVADEHGQAPRHEGGARGPEGRHEGAEERFGDPGPRRTRGRPARERREVRVVDQIGQGKLRPCEGRVGPLPDPFRHRRVEW